MNGQHTFIRKQWLIHINHLTLTGMKKHWAGIGIFDPSKALNRTKSYVFGQSNLGTMNYNMLPAPFSDTTIQRILYPSSLIELNEKNIKFILDPTKDKIFKGIFE